MAKFKVGDRVRFSGVSGFHESSGKEGRIVKIDKDYGDITIKADDGKTYTATESVAEKIANSAVRSTNAAVQEALNSACARNERFKKGDLVKMTSNDPSNRVWRIDEDYKDGSYRIVATTGRIEGLSIPGTMLKAANTCARNDRTQDIKDAMQKLAKVASRAAGVPATATFKWTPNSIGYVDLKFPDESAAKDFNYYTAIYAMRDAREAWPSWSWGIEGFTPPQRIGNILRIGLGHFGT